MCRQSGQNDHKCLTLTGAYGSKAISVSTGILINFPSDRDENSTYTTFLTNTTDPAFHPLFRPNLRSKALLQLALPFLCPQKSPLQQGTER